MAIQQPWVPRRETHITIFKSFNTKWKHVSTANYEYQAKWKHVSTATCEYQARESHFFHFFKYLVSPGWGSNPQCYLYKIKLLFNQVVSIMAKGEIVHLLLLPRCLFKVVCWTCIGKSLFGKELNTECMHNACFKIYLNWVLAFFGLVSSQVQTSHGPEQSRSQPISYVDLNTSSGYKTRASLCQNTISRSD